MTLCLLYEPATRWKYLIRQNQYTVEARGQEELLLLLKHRYIFLDRNLLQQLGTSG